VSCRKSDALGREQHFAQNALGLMCWCVSRQTGMVISQILLFQIIVACLNGIFRKS
jgi:hypothetical protein